MNHFSIIKQSQNKINEIFSVGSRYDKNNILKKLLKLKLLWVGSSMLLNDD